MAESDEPGGATVSAPSRPWMVVWDHFGPYHHARIAGLRKLAPVAVLGVQMAGTNVTYPWKSATPPQPADSVQALQVDLPAEKLGFWKAFRSAQALFHQKRPAVVFCPSYWPPRSLAIVLAARLAGARAVMMNDSHAGTQKSGAVGRWVKRVLLRLFDSALVAGEPQQRHFVSLGMARERICTGYDAVDNAYFQGAADAARADEARVRKALCLPERYILNLGRMVPKKNLAVLVRAFAKARRNGLNAGVRLVLVGSGEEESQLKTLCEAVGLSWQQVRGEDGEVPATDVLFYGFRQIDQNPSFFALAEGFVLPSLYEEWGLVVNEAMACGLPVLVSSTVGCAEDLVVEGQNGFTFDPESEDELAEKLSEICEDSEKRRAMGEASLRLIEPWGCDGFARNAILAARMALGLASKGRGL